MSLSQASRLVQTIAGPAEAGEYVKTRIGRAYDALVGHGFTWNRVRDLWHGDKRVALRPGEIELLKQIADRDAAEDAHEQDRIDTLARELAALEVRIVAARETLADRAPARPFRTPQTCRGAPAAPSDAIARPEMNGRRN
jgi:hypothetical protein